MALTVDELVSLAEGLIGETSVIQLLEGALAEKTYGLTSEQKGILVRFIAGERPAYDRPGEMVGRTALWEARRHLPKDAVTLDPDGYPRDVEDDPNFEYDEVNDVFVPKRVERSPAQKELPLTGEFDGIVLP